MNAAERAARLAGVRPYFRRAPWGINAVTADLLAYVLGLREEPVSDADFRTVHAPGNPHRSDFITDAQQVPLELARVLALLAEGRDKEAADLLGATITRASAIPADDDPDDEDVDPNATPPEGGEGDPPADPDSGTSQEEVVPATGEVVAPPTETPLPADFPEHGTLTAAGFATIESVMAATDADLRTIDGIGPAKLSLIRAAILAAA